MGQCAIIISIRGARWTHAPDREHTGQVAVGSCPCSNSSRVSAVIGRRPLQEGYRPLRKAWAVRYTCHIYRIRRHWSVRVQTTRPQALAYIVPLIGIRIGEDA